MKHCATNLVNSFVEEKLKSLFCAFLNERSKTLWEGNCFFLWFVTSLSSKSIVKFAADSVKLIPD